MSACMTLFNGVPRMRTNQVRFRPAAPKDDRLVVVYQGDGFVDCKLPERVTDNDVSEWQVGPNPPKEIQTFLED